MAGHSLRLRSRRLCSLPTISLLCTALLFNSCVCKAFESDDDEFVGGFGASKEEKGLDERGESRNGGESKASQLMMATTTEFPVVNFTRQVHSISFLLSIPILLHLAPSSCLPRPALPSSRSVASPSSSPDGFTRAFSARRLD